MNIKKVTTSIKIGNFILHPNKDSRNYIKVDYDQNLSNSMKLDNSGRVYLFVVNGEIKKLEVLHLLVELNQPYLFMRAQ